jgi:Histidine kinase-, DNA gyrase B-, and HSP90-like ATPase
MNDAFRMLFDQVKSGIIWVQRNGIVRYANKAAVQMTPCLLGSPLMDPVAERTIKAAGQDMLKLPFSFEMTTQESHPDTIRAVVINAPVGSDLMLLLNNVSEERWYSSALENLIGYIEVEMAKPIEVLMHKLPQVASVAQSGRRSVELETLLGEADELSTKLGKLRDLVSVFGQGAIQRDERIVMQDLIKEVLTEVLPQAQARNVTITTSGLDVDLPVVYGSHAWLSKALSEYLEHSVRSAQDDGLIEFSIVAMGTRLLLRARNQGLFVSNHERRSAFVPFGVGDGFEQSQARQGIGLALSQRIVEQHGGNVRIEDDFDAVDFVMEIPAGAPVSQDAQLSVEQAQRYAKDMAQLMARSMGKRPSPNVATLAPNAATKAR